MIKRLMLVLSMRGWSARGELKLRLVVTRRRTRKPMEALSLKILETSKELAPNRTNLALRGYSELLNLTGSQSAPLGEATPVAAASPQG